MNDQYVTRQGKVLFFRKGILSGYAVAEARDDCDAVGIQVFVNELYDALAALEEENERLKTQVAAPAVPEAHTFYVLHDATGGRKYIKKDVDDGCLAIFEREEDAQRAKRRHPGTEYKRVDYYAAPQPAEQPPLKLPDFVTDPDDSDEAASLWDHGYKRGWNACLEAATKTVQPTEQ